MKISHLVLPILALGTAAVLLVPTSSVAFTTLGFTLPTTQRDFRVFNNFSDPTANDNQTPHANFPGYQGAVMAIWKGCIEWGSTLHGDGNGDPHQPAGLGSGGANFDPTFQGEATGVGGIDDNIFSELAGSNGGVIGFTEMPDASGWRARYYSTWTWHDGPNVTTGSLGNFDLQGFTVLLYGYAIGLGGSMDTNASMSSMVSGTGTSARSLSADDIAGIQSIYGVASPSKPRITGISGGQGTLTITGLNFDLSDNEVWFTQATPGGTGDPVTATNVASTAGGTSITVNVPLDAGPGDVLVKVPGTTHDTLSNAWPVDASPCAAPYSFCLTAPNSVGPGSVISHSGSSSIATNDLTLMTTGNPPNAFGRFFYGMNQVAPLVFGNGWRCINPLVRLPTLTADGNGDASFLLDQNALIPPNTISPGETWAFQFWYRNPAGGGANFNCSDGLVVQFCP